MVQITIIRLEGYGPWTTTLGDDREHRLQILQARLYSDLQELFSEKKGLVFFNRFDEMFAVSNGISKEEHESILDRISRVYSNITISMNVGNGMTPYEAHKNARMAMNYNSSMSSRVNINNGSKGSDEVQIMHIDIDGSTSSVGSVLMPYDISVLITRLNLELSERFIAHGALTFFLGGDNFMVVSSRLNRDDVRRLLHEVMDTVGVRLKCGIGVAYTARDAAMLATRALDDIRNSRNTPSYDNIVELLHSKRV
jgi:GTP cyclohydrolase IIa